MNKSDIRVFIIEDDPTVGAAIRELVKKMGFQAVLCTNPTDAISQFRIQGAQLLIVDCLLPKTPGIELVQKMRADFTEDVPIILVSGIFKDKIFAKDALHKTGAVAFLTKPFNMAELQALILKHLERHIDDVSPLEALLTSDATPLEKFSSLILWGKLRPLIFHGSAA